MSKVILIYANCVNPKAKGDFMLACTIARDLSCELRDSEENLDIILTSTLDGMPRFRELYPVSNQENVLIDGEEIGLCALETFDAVNNTVVAFIEANRCKYAPSEIIKRILSPNSKFLFIRAANQPILSEPYMHDIYFLNIKSKQNGIYNNFSSKDIFIGTTGLGNDRLGLPRITKNEDLEPDSATQPFNFPNDDYGFMYLNALSPRKDRKLIVQYIKLTGFDQYILVGNFKNSYNAIESEYFSDKTLSNSKVNMPTIHFYQYLNNSVMRQTVSQSTGSLVLSTGVMSALEAMQDRKLTYYQDISSNKEFVASYLIAVKSIIANDSSLVGCMPDLIIKLSDLLFANKPLSNDEMRRTHDLLSMSSVNQKLVGINRKIIEQANGKVATKLLSFINSTRNTKDEDQLISVCRSLRKKRWESPSHDQALRRAAAWGRIFELKVLIKSMSADELNSKDGNFYRTALIWASYMNNFDCARLLVKANANLDEQDKNGMTALHYAVVNGNRDLIKFLIEEGASIGIQDDNSKSPEDCADSETLSFIQECRAHHNIIKI